jgi:hypothetical protein
MFPKNQRAFGVVPGVRGVADEQGELFGISTAIARYYLHLDDRLVS